jgi:hypothetical protein
LLAAATFLHGDRLPGVWVVLTGWHPEPVPDTQGQVPPDSVCRAVVFGLTSSGAKADGRRVRVCLACRRPGPREACCPLPGGGGFTLESLLAALTQEVDYSTTWIWNTEHGVIEIDRPGVRGELRR